ncbi:MAG: hypothetical protein ACM30H_04810, partial [Clostridia bacterium]
FLDEALLVAVVEATLSMQRVRALIFVKRAGAEEAVQAPAQVREGCAQRARKLEKFSLGKFP